MVKLNIVIVIVVVHVYNAIHKVYIEQYPRVL